MATARTNTRYGAEYWSKVFQGTFEGTPEEQVEKADSILDRIKLFITGAISGLDTAVGFTDLKGRLVREIYNLNDSEVINLKTSFKMMNNIIKEEIEFLESIGDESSMKDVLVLKRAFYQYTEDGIEFDKGRSIFEVAYGLVSWVIKKISKKISKWLQVSRPEAERTILDKFKLGLAGAAELLKKGFRKIKNVMIIAASAITGLVLYAGLLLFGGISLIVRKFKLWWEIRQLEDEDIEDFEDVEEEEIIIEPLDDEE